MDVTRRQFLTFTGAAGGLALLSGCAGFAPAAQPTQRGTLTFTTWGTNPELQGFEAAIEAFEAANSGATVTLNVVPYAQYFENIDAGLQAGTAPDVFRASYPNIGSYAGRGQLLDLTDYLESGFGDRFTAQMWAAVNFDGKPYGVPHITDTSTILFNRQALETAGITSVPDTLESAWTWEEFDEVATTLRAALPDDRYPFVYNWQGASVTRWFSWLFQADGRFLDEDLVTPAIDSDAGRAALEFTQSFFPRRLVPENNSVKSPTFAAETFFAETAAMTWGGTFLLPDAATLPAFEVAATYSPRNERSGGDLGGNPLVASAESPNAELAASFLAFVTEEQVMLDFCETASLLPTLQSLVGQELDFAALPDLSTYFVNQATTVKPQDAAQIASANMAEIRTVLADQLEAAFIGGQSAEDTLQNMTTGFAAAGGS